MTGIADMVAEFHAAAGQHYGQGDIADSEGRRRLHDEEHCELIEALCARDLVGTARELADVIYATYGTAFTLGIPVDLVLDAVHAANMSKAGADGRILLDEHGKAIKGPYFRPPDVAAVLAEACSCRGDQEDPGCPRHGTDD